LQVPGDTDASALQERFEYDPERRMFSACSNDGPSLERLGALTATVANDGDRMR
jgi:YD repeat-containing protein